MPCLLRVLMEGKGMAIDIVPLAEEVYYGTLRTYTGPFFLAGDIGGTNSNFGIFTESSDPAELLISLQYKSIHVTDFAVFLRQVVEYIKTRYGIVCERACIGAAGIIEPKRISVQPTNLSFNINLATILNRIPFKELVLINDFEAVALGVELLPEKDFVTVQPGVAHFHANKGFLGAGTGLGKSILTWHTESQRYLPVASEGGHADASFYTEEERALMDFIQKNYGSCPLSWETVLSGAGIQKIYQFLGTLKQYPVTEATKEIEQHDFNPDRISYYAQIDERCKDTFNFYIRFYARCAKNFALESLALNGIYIAGGIAVKNITMFFDDRFKQEFTRCGRQSKHLAQVPLVIIANYNVSLYGALVAARLIKQGLL
jgi:glucokinase